MTKTAEALACAGALPFVAGAAIAVSGRTGDLPFDVAGVLGVYSAVIASFLAGVHWHLAISRDGAPAGLLVLSNAVALAAWVAALIDAQRAPWIMFALLFTALLAIDRALAAAGMLPDWFYRLRIRVTFVVVASLMVVAARTLQS